MDPPALLYLEADDEVTSVVRRVRGATETRVVVVAPGRSRATSSVVALRLLARIAAEEGREIAIVGDALTRSLAGEAGLAAYVTVDDARRADPQDHVIAAPSRAGIHVVRGTDVPEETAPILAAAPARADPAAAETVSVPVSRMSPERRLSGTGGGRPRKRTGLAIGGALLALLLMASGIAGAILLPAASVTLMPQQTEIAARTYTVTFEDAERANGTVEATAQVSATGTYPILESATGTVIFSNFSGSAVDLAPGTLVAAGEQAFVTVVPVLVPEGSLTPEGFIQAGQAAANVMASAAGPAANVPAETINTVLGDAQGRLRGFANNDNRLVENPEPTSGGAERTGPEFTQADIDAAVEALRAQLTSRIVEELDPGDALVVPVGETAPEPVIEGLGDVPAGTRDVTSAEIRGTLAYDHWLVDSEELPRAAADELRIDPAALPAGAELVPDATTVEVMEALGTDLGAEVTILVTGRATAEVDEADVIARIRGRSLADAEAALADLGDFDLRLWPGWVDSVTDIEWRIEVTLEDASP